ncbi:MAG: hypothetical protein LUH14_10745 [Clostridiaceae bacterium]|nr:hypothetical protein [Clostridiaceae bacterium]
MAKLHSRGLVYCDFSTNNAFVSKIEEKNTVWLIDADNVDFQEKLAKRSFFTPGFGAPEVVKGKGCTFYSDSYAFAISLFWQLTGKHPFRGALMSDDSEDDFLDEVEEKANAGEFPWILDSDDDSNYIDDGLPCELFFSEELREFFDRTFSEEGKRKRYTRPSMFEWSYMLAKELDTTIRCSKCGMDYRETLEQCPWCDGKEKRITLRSKKATKKIWRFAHEVSDEDMIRIPLRVINGFESDACDERAFSIRRRKDDILFYDFNELYDWSVALGTSVKDAASFTDVYGQVSIPDSCTICCKTKNTGNTIIIEAETG